MVAGICGRIVQLMVGESEPTEISTARFMNLSLIIRNGRNSGSVTLNRYYQGKNE